MEEQPELFSVQQKQQPKKRSAEESDMNEQSSSKKSRCDDDGGEGGKEGRREGGGFKGYKSTPSSSVNNPYWIQFSDSKSVHHGVSKVSFASFFIDI